MFISLVGLNITNSNSSFIFAVTHMNLVLDQKSELDTVERLEVYQYVERIWRNFFMYH